MKYYYPFIFLTSFFLSLLLTPIVIRIASRIGLVDNPNARSVHTHPVARLGGVAIFIATMAVIISVLFSPSFGVIAEQHMKDVVIIVIASSVIFLIGLIDDIKHINARYKFLVELIVVAVMFFLGIRIDNLTITGLCSYQLPFILSFPLTALWIVGATNAVNLIDGLDGLAAGITAIAAGVIGVLAIYMSNILLAVIMFSLLGALLGFLFYNFNPAKIFLGDCGSLFIGFIVASASTVTATKSHAFVGFALPVLALGIPIFDTFFAMLRRFLERRRIMSPDRSHFHHRLLDMGLNQRTVVIIAYLFTLMVVGFGLFMMATRSFNTIIVFLCCLVVIVIGFRAVGAVRIRETIERISSKATMARKAGLEIREFEDVQLHFRNASTVDERWDALQLAARRFGFQCLCIKAIDQADKHLNNAWKKSEDIEQINGLIRLQFATDSYFDGKLVEVEIAAVKDSTDFETIGRRFTLLFRLLDESNSKSNLLC